MSVELTSGLLTGQDLLNFQLDGAIAVRNVLDLRTIEALREQAQVVVEQRLAHNAALGKPRPARPAFHNFLRIYKDNPVFREVLLESKVPEIARELMQSQKVIVFGDSLLIKEPGSRTRTPWHHDLPYWPVRGEQICSVWIALDRVTRANGGMEYVAGSHRWGKMFSPRYFDGTAPDTKFEPAPDIDANRGSYRILHWELDPGDVLVHQGLTLHGAGENTQADLSRRAYTPRYVGEKAWWDPEFHDSRGEPAMAALKKGDPVDKDGIMPVALIRRKAAVQ